MKSNMINIAELLKDCPSGMELDCTMLEGLEFDDIIDNECLPIRCRVKNPDGGYNVYNFTKYGCWLNTTFFKCVIFPKGKTTWEGFVPPCKFKGQTEKMEEREIAFMDWWLENHKGKLPTFADAIAWADKTMVEKACEWLSQSYTSGVLDWKNCDSIIEDFKKAMEE